MAGTATNRDSTKIQTGSPGMLFAACAVPGAGARATLHTDGTPDSTANPNAVGLGLTREGATMEIVPSVEAVEADELTAPIKKIQTAVTMRLTVELLQPVDFEILQFIASTWGTYDTQSGYDEMTVGLAATQTTTSLLLSWPLEADPTKFGVFHIYDADVPGGFSGFQISRKITSGLPITFEGNALTGRASADQVGNFWIQT